MTKYIVNKKKRRRKSITIIIKSIDVITMNTFKWTSDYKLAHVANSKIVFSIRSYLFIVVHKRL